MKFDTDKMCPKELLQTAKQLQEMANAIPRVAIPPKGIPDELRSRVVDKIALYLKALDDPKYPKDMYCDHFGLSFHVDWLMVSLSNNCHGHDDDRLRINVRKMFDNYQENSHGEKVTVGCDAASWDCLVQEILNKLGVTARDRWNGHNNAEGVGMLLEMSTPEALVTAIENGRAFNYKKLQDNAHMFETWLSYRLEKLK